MAEDLSFNVVALDKASKTFLTLADRVDKLSRRVDELDRKRANPKIDVDDKAATAKVINFDRKLDRLDGKTANVRVKTDVDKNTAGLLSQSALTFGQMAAGATALGAAMLPVAAAAGTLAASLAAPLAAAGGGLTLYGFLTGFAVKKTMDQKKEIDEAKKKLDGLEKGTKEYAGALRLYRSELQQLSPAQTAFLDNLDLLKSRFDGFMKQNGGAIFAPLNAGMRVLGNILPKVAPMFRAVSEALTGVINNVGAFTQSRGFDRFLNWFERTSGKGIRGFSRILGNIATGIGGIIGALTGRGFKVLDWFEGLSAKFAKLGRTADKKGSPVQKFLKFVDRVGPEVARLFKQIGAAILELLPPLARFGENVLKMVNNSLPVFVPLLKGAATAIAAISTAFAKMPPALQAAVLVGGVGMMMGRKGGKGGGMLSGLAGGLLGGGIGGGGRGGKHRGGVGGRMGVGGAAIGAIAGQQTVAWIQDLGNAQPKIKAIQKSILAMGRRGAGKLPHDFNDLHDTILRLDNQGLHHKLERSLGSYDEEAKEVRGLQSALLGIAKNNGIPAMQKHFRALVKSENLTQEETRALLRLMPRVREVMNRASGTQAAKGFRSLANAAKDVADRVQANLVPSVGNLARKFDLSRGQAQRLRNSLIAAAHGGKAQAKQFMELAKRLDLTKGQTNQLRKALGLIPKKTNTKVNVPTKPAEKDIGRLKNSIRGIPDKHETKPTVPIKAAEKDIGRLRNSIRDIPEKHVTKGEFDGKKGIDAAKRTVRQITGFFTGIKDEPVNVDLSTKASKIWRSIDGILGGAPRGQDGPGVQERAVGGRITGNSPTPTADNIPVMATAGEMYIRQRSTKKMDRQHPGALDHINRFGEIPGFAWGGRVGIKPGMSQRGANKAAGKAGVVAESFATRMGKILSKKTNELLMSLRQSGGGLTPAQVARGKSFAKRQDGKPYIWGGVGPRGYDCSGFQSAIYNAALGRSPYSRLFATGSLGGFAPLRPGKGAFNVGWFTGSPGHVSGEIGGLKVESTGDHVRVGAAARSPRDPMFNRHGQLTSAAGRKHSGGFSIGGGEYDGGSVRGIVRSIAARRGWDTGRQWDALKLLIHRESSWNPRANNPDSSAAGLFQKMQSVHGPVEKTVAGQTKWGLRYIKGRYGNPVGALRFHNANGNYAAGGRVMPRLFDQGGVLPPGLSLAANNTGRNEIVRTDEQTREEREAAREERREEREAAREERREERQDRNKEQRERRQERRQDRREKKTALKDFEPVAGKNSMERALRAFKRWADGLLKGKGQKRFDRIFEKLGKRMERLAGKMDKNNKELAKVNKKAAPLRAKRKALASSVADQFKADPFEGSLAEFSLQVRANRNDARRMKQFAKRAKAKGLDGKLMRDLASSGNFELMGEFSRSSKAEIRHFEKLYKQRDRAAKFAGGQVATGEYAAELRPLNRSTNKLERTNRRLEKRMERFEGSIEKSVERGVRRGNRRGGARQRARAGGRN